MFINDQYLFNTSFSWAFQREMEMLYFTSGVYEADLLYVFMVGA